MTANDKKVLAFLAEGFSHDGFGFYSFAPIARKTKLTIREVRLSCRRLKRKGLAKFGSGLWTDEGPYGSGYACTTSGLEAVQS